MSDEQWGPWIEHDGSGCPDNVRGRVIHVIFEAPDASPMENSGLMVDAVMACCESWNGEKYGWAGGHNARWMGFSDKMRWVTRYRIRQLSSAASITAILERIAADPHPVKEDAAA